MSRSARFWLNDLEPLGGRLRFAFYAGILAMFLAGTSRSPLFAYEVFVWTDPDFYTPVGIFSWFGVDWVSEGLLRALAGVGIAALCCSAVGLGRSVAPWIAAVCLFILYGIVQGAVGVTHRWHVPIYALIALCFAATDDGYSFDEWLADRFPGYPRQSGPALFRTGFARKLVLLFAVSTFFSGFVAKIIESGFAWGDGSTLHFVIAKSHSRSPALAEFIINHHWATVLLASGSLAVEGLAPLALISKKARHAFVGIALGFHLGIMLVMSPRYFPQMWCYILLVDWGAIGRSIRRHRGWELNPISQPAVSAATTRAAGIAGVAIAAGLCVIAFARIEFWPLTHIPMYSVYRGPAGAFTTEHLRDEAQLRGYATTCVDVGLCGSIGDWFQIDLVESGGARESLLRKMRINPQREKSGALSKQSARVLRTLIARITLSRPRGALGFDPDSPLSEAERELRALLPGVRRSVPGWKRYARLEVSIRLAAQDVLLTSFEMDRIEPD